MKHQKSPQGKVYRFKSKSLWSEDAKNDVRVPVIVLAHKVIALEKSEE